MKNKIFITGAAGYIGSHVARHFLSLGSQVIAYDDFSTGFRQSLEILGKKYKGLRVVKGDIRDFKLLRQELKKFRPELVVHLAARCSVDESTRNPFLYFSNNSFGTAVLLEAMRLEKIKKLIFSSTCAVYGEVQKLPVSEKHSLSPTNPYGESKLVCEKEIIRFGETYGFKYLIFRFFNVCGAANDGLIGDSKKPSSLLVQNAVRGAMGIEPFYLTCPKVKTPDGTPVRDYIDVEDLARAHASGYKYLNSGGESAFVNLGSGQGWSVKEIISTVGKICGVRIAFLKGRMRNGEYAKLYANTALASKILKFKPQKTLKQSVESLQKWYSSHPHGYGY